MAKVRVFASTGRFLSYDEMRRFIDVTYTDDGIAIPSPFMREVGISRYEPTCIEAIHSERPVPLDELLIGASWSDQWLPRLSKSLPTDATICVFEPNQADHPQDGSLEYCGDYEYDPSVMA